jgi:prepilin peptidase CpaA
LSNPPVIIQVLILLTVIPAAIFDLRQRRVPNWITLPAALIGIGLNTFLYEMPGFWISLKGLGLAFLIYFPLYLLRGMGAGDAKLMAAVGAALGPANWLGVLFLTALLGGIAALIAVASRGRLRRTFRNIWFILLSLLHRQAPFETNPELDVKNVQAVRLPHAVAIALGVFGFLAAAAIWAPK